MNEHRSVFRLPVRSIAIGCCVTGVLASVAAVRLLAFQVPPLGDPSKFGTCENPTPQAQDKCEPQEGNCLIYTEFPEETPFVLGQCVTFEDIQWDPVDLPDGTKAKSAKAIEARAYGECEGGSTTDTCNECGKYWCCKAKFWANNNCPADEASKTYAVAASNQCDPN
jgi:hypothetical protein